MPSLMGADMGGTGVAGSAAAAGAAAATGAGRLPALRRKRTSKSSSCMHPQCRFESKINMGQAIV